MPFKVEDLVFRLKIVDDTQAALKPEDGKGQALGEDILFNCGRTPGAAGVSDEIEEDLLLELLAKMREKLTQA